MAANIVETSRVFARTRGRGRAHVGRERRRGTCCKREYLEPDWDEAPRAGHRPRAHQLSGADIEREPHRQLRSHRARRVAADFRARGAGAMGGSAGARTGSWPTMPRCAMRRCSRSACGCAICVQPAEHFVEFYARSLPRQVSSAAALEHFHAASERSRSSEALTLDAGANICARRRSAAARAISRRRAASAHLSVPVEYRFAPGEADDGATLRVPLLALPTLNRGGGGQRRFRVSSSRASTRCCARCPRRRGALSFPLPAAAAGVSRRGGPARPTAQAREILAHETRGDAGGAAAQFDPDAGARDTSSPGRLGGGRRAARSAPVPTWASCAADLRSRRARELDAHARSAYPALGAASRRDELPESRALELEAGHLAGVSGTRPLGRPRVCSLRVVGGGGRAQLPRTAQ